MTAENEASRRPRTRGRAERVRTVTPILEIFEHARETLKRLQRRAAKATPRLKTQRPGRDSQPAESAGSSES
jgi:hypothetical protein